MIETNIRKFSSLAELNAYRGHDGWLYPSVAFVEDGDDKQIHYNNEFIMRWYDDAGAKVPEFSGDVTYAQFKAWVDGACFPCEVKKADKSVTYIDPANLATTPNRTSADYLQMVELKNINIGLFKNSSAGWKEVRFNFNHGCPRGFHKWFAHPYWNKEKKAFTKLVGRYDIIHNADGETIDVCAGRPQSTTESGANWSANLMLQKIKATGTAMSANLLSWTYWEYLVLSYIFCAYHKTFNTQSIYQGLQSGGSVNGDQYVKGGTDSITAHTGEVSSGGAYKFMHIENALHGSQWIWGAGWIGDASTNPTKYWLTYDDIKANKNVNLAISDSDVIGKFPYNQNNAFISNIDLFGIPTTTGASSTTGFYDAMWSYNLYSNRIAYLGGTSWIGASCGCWARALHDDASYSGWNRRGRLTMNR